MAVTPRWTVALPTFNGERHLAETLRSVIGQVGVDFDLIVCDDQSTDATPEIVRAVAGRAARFERNPARLGLAGNWNRCVALARSPFVAVVHQDDLLAPDHLARHDSAFGDNPAIGLVASASEVIDENGRPVPASIVGPGGLGGEDRLLSPAEGVAALAPGNPLRCSAVTIRKHAHEAAGGFDPDFRYAVDWDFWLRVAQAWSIAWIAKPTVSVRWHPRSETHTFKTGTLDLDETERVLDRFDATVARIANPRLARAYLNRAHDALKAGDGALARRCLRRALARDPGVWRSIASDPRLAVQMLATAASPSLAARVFRRRP